MSLAPGLTYEATTTVTDANTAAAVGSGGVHVFSTPMMIALMEMASLNAVQPYLNPGDTTVGTLVNVSHLAATPLGQQVRAVARLETVAGKRLVFTVEAFDETEKIGQGTHERYIVTMDKFLARVNQKQKP
ncbi:MAG TPA: thioesterase family protein [Symbiobacteriaceae bacterium]|jgi:predicted thioesterase